MQLTYPLDKETKRLIRDEVKDAFGDLLFDGLGKYFHYTSIFEGSNIVASSDGYSGALEGGIQSSVKPVANREAEIRKTLDNSGLLFNFEARSRFKSTALMTYGDTSATTLANSTIYIVHGDRDAGLGYYGFKVSGANIQGCAKAKNGSEQTVTIGTYVNDIVRDYEAVYDPRSGIVFYLDGEPRGRIQSSSIGKLGDSQPNFFNTYVKKTNTAISITSSTDATPIEITTGSAHGFETGDIVTIEGHTTNTAANNTNSNRYWAVTKVDSTKFTLDGSAGSGAGAGASGSVDFARILSHTWVEVTQAFIEDFS